MKIKIYQIDIDKDKMKHFCLPYNMIKDDGCIDLTSYDLVFEHDDYPQHTLNEIYEMFNVWDNNLYKNEYKGHSLSVSDIIYIDNSDKKHLNDGYYFVDSFGFKDITGYCEGYLTCLAAFGYLDVL